MKWNSIDKIIGQWVLCVDSPNNFNTKKKRPSEWEYICFGIILLMNHTNRLLRIIRPYYLD